MATVVTSLADLDGQHARVAITPFKSVTQLLNEALGRSWGPGPSSTGVDAVRAGLAPEHYAALAPVLGVRRGWYLPSCLMPQPDAPAASFDDELDRMATMASVELVDELEALGLLTTVWSDVAQVPRPWLDVYIGALRRTWSAVEPHWWHATRLLEREVERVGTALVRGSFAHVLDGLLPDAHVADDRWHIGCPVVDDSPPRPVDVTTNLWLVPTVTAPQVWSMGTDDDVVGSVSYSLPGLARLDGAPPPRCRDGALASLLGGPRAEILRLLDQPMVVGAIAGHLLLVPSGVSHHVNAMERAGLVRRESMGTRTVVHRSARGTALLHLYADDR